MVFFDPPYLYASRMKAGTMLYRSLERLARDEITTAGALLVLRCGHKTELDVPAAWRPEQMLNYSSMDVHLFRKDSGKSESGAAP